jgi:serine protease
MEEEREPEDETPEPKFDRPRVVVRFREGVRLANEPDLGDLIECIGTGPWKQLINEFPGVTLNPVFTYPTHDPVVNQR